MATFLLVHGGWHGAWCWERVTPILRVAGHAVHAPTLTGLGERAHLLTPDVGLDTHVQDVMDVLTSEELTGVILVGHSYAGMVIAEVAGRAADRIARLVFLDAFVPEDGQSLFDLLLRERREFYLQGARERGDGWRVPPPPAQALGLTEEAEARWLDGQLTPQSLRMFEQPVSFGNPEVETLPRTYIHCTAGPMAPSFAPFARRFREARNPSYHELATGHDAMLTEPEALCDVLLALSSPQQPSR